MSICSSMLWTSTFIDVYVGGKDSVTVSTAPAGTGSITARLSTLDRYLAVWILAAMAFSLALGRFVPGLGDLLGSVTVAGVSLPIAVGLLVMMYPVLVLLVYVALWSRRFFPDVALQKDTE